jgi:hypothetical protein
MGALILRVSKPPSSVWALAVRLLKPVDRVNGCELAHSLQANFPLLGVTGVAGE